MDGKEASPPILLEADDVKNPHEILVAYRGDPALYIVMFSGLHAIIDQVSTMIFLWNTNSYVVNCESRTLIINGGRAIHADELQDCTVLYRKRNRLDVSISGEESRFKTTWLLGLQDSEMGASVFIKISEDGDSWEWGTVL